MTFFKHIKEIELAVLLISNFEIDDHTSVEFWYLKKHIFLPLQHAFQWSRLAFASLESLGQDKTFKSLESLVRLYPKVSKVIIFFFWMHKNA